MPELTPGGRRGLAIGGFSAFCLGVWMAFLGPYYAAKHAKESLASDVETISIEADRLVAAVADRTWFTDSYTQAVLTAADTCGELTESVAESMSDFKGVSGSAAILEIAAPKRATLDEASIACDRAAAEITRQDEARVRAVADLRSLRERLTAVVGMHMSQSDTLNDMTDRWLSKYTDPLASKLATNGNNHESIKTSLVAATNMLPADNEIGSGDPDRALRMLDVGEGTYATVVVLKEEIAARLQYLTQAESLAGDKTQEAAADTVHARETWDTTLADTGFDIALAPFWQMLTEADHELVVAEAALSKRDWPVAYEAALVSLENSYAVSSGIVRLLALVAENAAAIDRWSDLESDMVDLVSETAGLEDTLSWYHHSSEWSSVSDHAEDTDVARERFVDAVLAAIDANSVNEQAFDSAVGHLKTAEAAYDLAWQLYEELSDRVDELEAHRLNWDSTIASADSAIEAERSQINEYGDYDSSAESAFNRAVEHYNNAVSYANSKRYEDATDEAEEAIHVANGVGDDAEEAYDDYVEEQEAAERRAASAAAAAAAALEDDDSGSSGVFSYAPSLTDTSSGDGDDWASSDRRSSDGDDWD